MSLIQWAHFPPLGDDRGSLVALEAEKTVPFEIKRVYYIFGTQQGVARGFHAHHNLKQVAVCVTGKCLVFFILLISADRQSDFVRGTKIFVRIIL